jgi:uncharacterized membrane protein SpoIIM required for sporulation
MIIDIAHFIDEERHYWTELEQILNALERDAERKLGMREIKRFHYLYQRTSTDLDKLMTFSSETATRLYLESLVGRAYCEIHENRERSAAFSPFNWFFKTFPRTFRLHVKAFYLALAITVAGCVFGGLAITFDPDAKEALMPFSQLLTDPSERVAQEENAAVDRLKGTKAIFSSYLMTHNTKVAIFCMASGIVWGIGTLILLFTNGVMLGAVALDYILSGEAIFLMGWLLPHGVIEIPAILLAGQAGLVLASAIIGRGTSISLRNRLNKISRDLVTLIFGTAIMLVWAGIIEGFFSQYHEPVIPYSVKIGFGIVELMLLILFLSRSGMDNKRMPITKTTGYGQQ